MSKFAELTHDRVKIHIWTSGQTCNYFIAQVSIVIEAGSWQNCHVPGSHFNSKRKLRQKGLPRWHRGKESSWQCRRCAFSPWVGKILWRKKWQPTPLFVPGKSHGQRNLEGYSLWGGTELDTTEHANTHTYTPAYWVFGRSAGRLESILTWRELETASWKLPHDYRCSKCYYRFWTLS